MKMGWEVHEAGVQWVSCLDSKHDSLTSIGKWRWKDIPSLL